VNGLKKREVSSDVENKKLPTACTIKCSKEANPQNAPDARKSLKSMKHAFELEADIIIVKVVSKKWKCSRS
jgi:hypothetical protein